MFMFKLVFILLVLFLISIWLHYNLKENEYVLETPVSIKMNACLLVLCRNQDLHAIRSSLRQIEDRFNKNYHYPVVFLNEVPFSQEFMNLTSKLVSGKVEYGIIPKEHWSYPEWINVTKADLSREEMGRKGIIYGRSLSYRFMCRYFSGFFYLHPLIQKYDYYWRIEPGVDFFCDIVQDPFVIMKKNNYKYGFTITLLEFADTIPTLWSSSVEFIRKNPSYIHANASIEKIVNGRHQYNLCHFWSNFEIADLQFYKSRAYQEYFNYLDRKGGFFYERWGDAPVHSIAAALFLDTSQIHFFKDVGYRHPPISHCPVGRSDVCDCDESENFDFTPYSCLKYWMHQ